MVVRRGFPAPDSLHSPLLRAASDAHLFQVITAGYGVMYPFADRIGPGDRWAIVAYVRALQRSQHAGIDDVPPVERRALLRRSPDAANRYHGAARWRCFWVAAGAGALLLVVTGRHNGQSWLASYLFVWLFVLGLSLGSLAWSVVHNLTGGEWGLAIRPFLKAALQLTALSALLALPLLLAPPHCCPGCIPRSVLRRRWPQPGSAGI